MLILPSTKITLISKEIPEIERSPLGDKDIFVLSAVSDLETKFELKTELANQLCERRQIKEEITLEEFDETPLPDVPFVDDYVDPIVSYPVNLCTIQFNQTEGNIISQVLVTLFISHNDKNRRLIRRDTRHFDTSFCRKKALDQKSVTYPKKCLFAKKALWRNHTFAK